MAYANPGWTNGAAPAISAENLNNISNTLEAVPAENGGTGRSTLTGGAIITGNGTDPVGLLSGTGAVYANTSNSPQFGTLPVSCGGTGVTTLEALRTALGLTNGGFVASSTAPDDTSKLWIDTGNSGIMKYYDGSVWVPIRGTFA